MIDLHAIGEQSGWLANLIQVATFFGLPTVSAIASAIVAWVWRGRSLRRKAQAQLADAVKSLSEQVEQGKAQEASLVAQLELNAPRFWIESYEEDLRRNKAERALSHLQKGFSATQGDLREAMYRLALHYYYVAADSDTDVLRKAWYFSSIASAIRDSEDIRLLRDGLREIDAELARTSGTFNASQPKWNEFESLPGFVKNRSDVLKLLNVMGAKAKELANTGNVVKAQRLQARITYIAGLHFGPTDREMLTIKSNAAAMSALISDWEAVLAHTEFLVPHLTRQFGPDSPNTLQARHWFVAALTKSGRENARSECEALISDLERAMGKDSVLAFATRSLLNGRPSTSAEEPIIGSSRGYYEVKHGTRVPPPAGLPPLGESKDK